MKRILLIVFVLAIAILMTACININININGESGDIKLNLDNASGDINFSITGLNEKEELDSNQKIIEMVKKYREFQGEYIPSNIVIEGEDGDELTIHLYDVVDDHTATTDWYYINRTTGKGTNLFGKDIDLNIGS